MAAYKITIDRETCIGDKNCCEEAPATFEPDEEGKVVVVDPEGDPAESILSAARHCRLQAISLSDAATGGTVWPRPPGRRS